MSIKNWIFWLMSWYVGLILIAHYTNNVVAAMSLFGMWVMLFNRLTN